LWAPEETWNSNTISIICNTISMGLTFVYIKVGSPMEVNLPGALHRNIIEVFNKGEVTPNTFDVAQKSVFHLMENDSFRRFIKTEDYKNYLKTKGYQKIRTRDQRKSSMILVLNTLENQPE
jgi:hypothetical protein